MKELSKVVTSQQVMLYVTQQSYLTVSKQDMIQQFGKHSFGNQTITREIDTNNT